MRRENPSVPDAQVRYFFEEMNTDIPLVKKTVVELVISQRIIAGKQSTYD
jgi:hypothetical protein